jgi:hypothetical protein
MTTVSHLIATCTIHDAEVDEKQPISEKVTKCRRIILFSGMTFRTYSGSKLLSRCACCWHYFYPYLTAHYIMCNWKWKGETALRNPDLSSWTQERKWEVIKKNGNLYEKCARKSTQGPKKGRKTGEYTWGRQIKEIAVLSTVYLLDRHLSDKRPRFDVRQGAIWITSSNA